MIALLKSPDLIVGTAVIELLELDSGMAGSKLQHWTTQCKVGVVTIMVSRAAESKKLSEESDSCQWLFDHGVSTSEIGSLPYF